MISRQSPSTQYRRTVRWHTLPPDEKLREFRELTQSPYWQLLPEEIKAKIHNLVNASTVPRNND